MSDNDPDWATFETYKGEEAESKMPRWLAQIFYYVMILVILSVVFSVGGFMGFIAAYDQRGRIVDFIMAETPAQAWTRFIIGGSVSVGLVIYWRYKRMR